MCQLKRAGISQCDLIRVYMSVVRPVLEYACPVWHTNLPKYLSDNIEIIQKRALKSIFPGEHCKDILNDIGMCTLKDSRDFVCDKYFRGMTQSSHKLHNLRPGNTYPPLPQTRSNRYRDSLIPWGLNHWQ